MSPTINFTNATGTFTYTEATPPDPVPPANTHGLIENFTNANGQYWKCDGLDVGNNTTNPWSLTKLDDYTLRFEVRHGDVWAASGGSYTDGPEAERCEIGFDQNHLDEGALLNWEGIITVLAGPKNTGSWCTLVQLHATTNVAPTYAPFSINLQQNTDKLQISLEEPKQSANNYVYTSPNAIERGKPMDLRAKVKMGPTGNGSVVMTWDGKNIVNFNGKVGATNSKYYWKNGIYRGAAPETTKADFSHIHMYTG
jgi:hypothetical protein